jgi:DNA transposition AAA+ family ATPase
MRIDNMPTITIQTASAFNGAMEGNNSIISKDNLEDLSKDERIKRVENILIKHPQVNKIVEKIKACHQDSKRSIEPKCLFITGLSGCGKTTIARYYEGLHPRKITKEGSEVPVLSAKMFAPATVKNIASGLLYSLGDPMADKGTITSQTIRLYTLIKNCKVELIIIDEFQHLIDRDSDKILKVASDWIKNLLNETGVPMIVIGMPNSVRILKANAQLERRFRTQMKLLAFNWNTAEDRGQFMTLLKFIEKALPLKEPSRLCSHETAFRIFCASRGIISNVMKIVRGAAILAIKSDYANITLDTLALAYGDEMIANEIISGNPFLLDESSLKVPEPQNGEEYHWLAKPKSDNGKQIKISQVLSAS